MPAPLSFTSASPRFALPLLFPGQAQKEFFVNQAHALTDMLLHPLIEEVAATPPAAPGATPELGQTWLVGAGATGVWAGQVDALASWQAGVWLFVPPSEGMRVFDRSAGQFVLFRAGGWLRAETPSEPAGGTTTDSEARETLARLIEILRIAGILPAA